MTQKTKDRIEDFFIISYVLLVPMLILGLGVPIVAHILKNF